MPDEEHFSASPHAQHIPRGVFISPLLGLLGLLAFLGWEPLTHAISSSLSLQTFVYVYPLSCLLFVILPLGAIISGHYWHKRATWKTTQNLALIGLVLGYLTLAAVVCLSCILEIQVIAYLHYPPGPHS